jgi:hypothetical protein
LLPGAKIPKTILDYLPAFDLTEVRKTLKKPIKEMQLSESFDAKISFYHLPAKSNFGVLLFSADGRLIRRLSGHLPDGPKVGKLSVVVHVRKLQVDALLADFVDKAATEKLVEAVAELCDEFCLANK